MNLDQLRAHCSSDQPQAHGLAMVTITQIGELLARLESIGHSFCLEVKPKLVSAVEYPLMLYKGSAAHAHEQTVVHSSEAKQRLLEDGWREHPNVNGPQGPEAVAAVAMPRTTAKTVAVPFDMAAAQEHIWPAHAPAGAEVEYQPHEMENAQVVDEQPIVSFTNPPKEFDAPVHVDDAKKAPADPAAGMRDEKYTPPQLAVVKDPV